MDNARYGKRKIYQEIDTERQYQDDKWGGLVHDLTESEDDWIKYIREYSEGTGRAEAYPFRRRMVKVAALAVAAIEAHDVASGDSGPSGQPTFGR